MTALDDFVAEHDRPLRLRRPARSTSAWPSWSRRSGSTRQPGAAPRCSTASRARRASDELLELAEDDPPRGDASSSTTSSTTRRAARREAHGRYLDAAEGRAARRALPRERGPPRPPRRVRRANGPPAETATLRDPVRHDKEHLRRLRGSARRAGKPGDRSRRPGGYFPFTDDGPRPARPPRATASTPSATSRCAGDLVECGTGRGGGAIFLRGYLDGPRARRPHGLGRRPFRRRTRAIGRQPASHRPRAAWLRPPADLNHGARRLRPLRPARRPGALPAGRRRRRRCPDAPIEQVALLRLGADVGARRRDRPRRALRPHQPRRVRRRRGRPRPRVAAAVDAFRRRRGIDEPIEQVDWSRRVWRKPPTTATPRAADARRRRAGARPCAAGTAGARPASRRPHRSWSSSTTCGARRQRTLHSLSRALPAGHRRPRLRGHRRRERLAPTTRSLGDEFVAAFGPEFRYIDLGDDATPSPVAALNRGIGRVQRAATSR